MDIERERREDWFLNSFHFDDIVQINDATKRRIENKKYISISSKNFEKISQKIELLIENNIDLNNKVFVIEIVDGFYLTHDQCKQLEETKTFLEKSGAKFKIKDGKYWELEEVSVVATKLDDVVTKINTATIEENGKIRFLNEMEKFLWAYSFVANRKYQKNEIDNDSSRQITSIMTTGDCVCVGFATILKELCSKLNIECYINSCQVYDKNVKDSFGHRNNTVIVNSTAYYCDACWDCVSEARRPMRTFANCLVSFEDIKDSGSTTVYDTTAPYADIEGDLLDIKKKLNIIQSKEKLTEDEFKEFVNLSSSNTMSKYINLVPKFEYNDVDFFMNRKYKEEALYYYTKIIDLIEQKRIKEPLKLEDFENSLINIYKAMGMSEEKAKEKTNQDINATIYEAGFAHDSTSKNCFANEYYKQLET